MLWSVSKLRAAYGDPDELYPEDGSLKFCDKDAVDPEGDVGAVFVIDAGVVVSFDAY